jgi:hypothetical protein
VRAVAAVAGGIVDLRLQFCDLPFPTTATHDVVFCIDLDRNPATGSACGAISGAEVAVDITRYLPTWPSPGWDLHITSLPAGLSQLSACSMATFSPEMRTLRIAFPVSYLDNDTDFSFVVGSAFGGSFGANESTARLVNQTQSLPELVGLSICDRP